MWRFENGRSRLNSNNESHGKATGFKSPRINCRNITQVIWIWKVFITLTSYYIQSYLLRKCIKPPPPGMYKFFKTAEAATGGVPLKRCSRKSRNTHNVGASLVSLESTLLKKRLQNIYFPVNIKKFLRTPIWEHVYMRPEVNSNRFEVSLRGKISLRCEVTSLSAFTWLRA